MSRKETLKWLCILFSSFAILGIVIGILSAKVISQQEYQSISQLVGAFSTNSQLEDAFVHALKESGSDDFINGKAVLEKYNYSLNTFWNQNIFKMLCTSLILFLILAILFSFVWFLLFKKQKSRIAELTTYLESINLGRDTILVRKEDNFSFLEDEIYKTVTELRESRENALLERQSLADNLADISHQLKTPITSMSLMTQLLSESLNEEDAIYIEKLNRQLVRLESLVSSLLTLSKLDAGTFELEKESVDVYAMLTCASEPMEDIINQKRQQLLIQSEPNIDFLGDAAWTAEAFLNLIKNCSEHTPNGEVISICYSQNPLYTEIIVQDNGKGFDKDDLSHIFERFYKGKNASKDSVGIGLALAKSIISKQNGTIRAENASEGGAKFIVKFYK